MFIFIYAFCVYNRRGVIIVIFLGGIWWEILVRVDVIGKSDNCLVFFKFFSMDFFFGIFISFNVIFKFVYRI